MSSAASVLASSFAPAPTTYAGDIFPTFVTPAEARAKLNQVRSQYENLDIDIQASAVSEQFKKEWGVARDTYAAFFRDTIDNFIAINLGTKATIERAEQFERDGIAWREAFKAQGGQPTGPAPIPPPPPPSLGEVTGSVERVGRTVIILMLVGGGIYLVSKMR